MGVYDEVRQTQEPAMVIKEPIVKAKKRLHKGFLFGHISNGGGIVKLTEEYALKFIAHDDSYVTVYLLDYGKELNIETQSWNKTKKIVKQVIKKLNVEKDNIAEEDLF